MLMLPSSVTPLVAWTCNCEWIGVPVIWIEASRLCWKLRSTPNEVNGPKVWWANIRYYITRVSWNTYAPIWDTNAKTARGWLSRPLRELSPICGGSIPMAMDGQYGTIGATGETFYEHFNSPSRKMLRQW